MNIMLIGLLCILITIAVIAVALLVYDIIKSAILICIDPVKHGGWLLTYLKIRNVDLTSSLVHVGSYVSALEKSHSQEKIKSLSVTVGDYRFSFRNYSKFHPLHSRTKNDIVLAIMKDEFFEEHLHYRPPARGLESDEHSPSPVYCYTFNSITFIPYLLVRKKVREYARVHDEMNRL